LDVANFRIKVGARLRHTIYSRLIKTVELEVYVGAPAKATLDGDMATKVLGISFAERKSIAKTGKRTRLHPCITHKVKTVFLRFITDRRETVFPDFAQISGVDTTTSITNANGNILRLFARCRYRDLHIGDGTCPPMFLHSSPKGVLEQFRKDILQVNRQVCKREMSKITDVEFWPCAILHIANLPHKICALREKPSWGEVGIHDPDQCGILYLVQGNMLLCNQPRANSCPQMLVQEGCDLAGRDVFATFLQAQRKGRDCIGMILDNLKQEVQQLLVVL